MEFPALMPQALLYCETISSEEQLFELLVQKPIDLVLFFETASDDETWSELHVDLMKKIIDWLTQQALEDRLSAELCQRVVRSIQIHHAVLERMVSKNLEVQLEDTNIPINSLLLAVTSDFFKNIIFSECRDKNTHILNLKPASYELFAPVEAFATTGNIPDVWKKEQKEVEMLLRQSLAWNVESVAQVCQLTLKKYINSENALDLLIQAQRELWIYFKRECIDFINDKMSGFRLDAPTGERLAFEFLDYSDSTMQVFQRLQAWITDLICKKSLSDQVQFSNVVRKCPKLILLDISGSLALSANLQAIPKDLQALSLAECFWLQPGMLKVMAEICPAVKELILSGNYQLNNRAWGELIKFQHLKSLNLARCHQITDDDLITILKACPGLVDLQLDACRKIGDRGFFELAKNVRLTTLSLEHCAISDSALLEIAARCRSLSALNLRRCDQLTEKGFKELAKHAFALRELNLQQCEVSEAAVQEIRRRHPYLRIATNL